MKNILFIADDWGVSEQVQAAVTELHKIRAIDGASLMMGQRCTAQAVDYATGQRDLLVGIHLFANDPECRPLSMRRWPWGWPGDSIGLARVGHTHGSRRIILAELQAQLRADKPSVAQVVGHGQPQQ